MAPPINVDDDAVGGNDSQVINEVRLHSPVMPESASHDAEF